MPDSRPEDRRRILDLVAQALEAMEREGPAALDDLCRQHPALAADLRERVGLLRETGMVQERIPERLGEFRLIKRLGGGGMGVVYLAEQERPRRQVALKLVRPEQLFFPGARERFDREIEAVARLSHPGIVPVFSHGESEGLPYFAMELVTGVSLEGVVAALHGRAPDSLRGADLQRVVEAQGGARGTGEAAGRLFGGSWPFACLRIARQVAEALQHAHERGVLHRDIKPSNIMLTADGRALLLDFGLAAAEGSQRLTTTGSRLGSLAYMSPEQLRGEGPVVDARSDVYSLGVTLYELLTLRAPYSSPSAEVTRARVLAGEPVSPRVLNPSLERDGETVLLKAMDPERGRRYASAAALARDLGNALELRPVEARRAGAWLRARRWTQRRPALATALAAGLLLLVGGPIVFGVQQARASQRIEEQRDLARDAERAARESATAAREAERVAREAERVTSEQRDLARAAERQAQEQAERARANLLEARDAVDLMLTQVAEEALTGLPQFEPLRRQLLEAALGFYERFLAGNEGDDTLREATGRAARRMALLHGELGQVDEALAVLDRAESLARAGRLAAPGDDLWLDLLGDALGTRATVLWHARRPEEARTAAEESLTIRQRRAGDRPDDIAALIDLEEIQGAVAVITEDLGAVEAAIAAYREQIASNGRVVELAEGTADEDRARASLVISRNNLGNFLRNLGRVDEALAELEPVAGQIARLDLAAIREPLTAQGVATALSSLGRARWEQGGREQALVELRRAALLMEDVFTRAPAFPEVNRLLAVAWSNLGTKLTHDPAQWPAAEEALARSIEVGRAYAALIPEPPRAAISLATCLVNHASLLVDLERLPEAVTGFEEGVALCRRARAADPADGEASAVFNAALQHLAFARRSAGDLPGCAATAEELAAAFPDDPRTLRTAAGYLASSSMLAGEGPVSGAWRQRGLDLLSSAIDAGWSDIHSLRDATDLTALRDLPGYSALVERLAGASGEP